MKIEYLDTLLYSDENLVNISCVPVPRDELVRIEASVTKSYERMIQYGSWKEGVTDYEPIDPQGKPEPRPRCNTCNDQVLQYGVIFDGRWWSGWVCDKCQTRELLSSCADTYREDSIAAAIKDYKIREFEKIRKTHKTPAAIRSVILSRAAANK